MAFQVSPGVQVKEVDLTNVVPAVSSTSGAFAGSFQWGPVDEVKTVSDAKGLVDEFSEPANTNAGAEDFYSAEAFLRYGSSLRVVRVNSTGLFSANSGGSNSSLLKNHDEYVQSYESGALVGTVGQWTSRCAGSLGNSLKVSVCASSDAYYNDAATTTSGEEAAGQTVITLATGGGALCKVRDIVTFGAITQQYRVTAINSDNITVEAIGQPTGSGLIATVASGTAVNRYWEFYSSFDKAPGKSASALAAGGSNDEIHVVVADEDGTITGIPHSILETYAFVSMASDAKDASGQSNYYKKVIGNKSEWVYWSGHNTAMITPANQNRTHLASATTSFLFPTLPMTASLANGADGRTPTAAQKYGAWEDHFKDGDLHDISFLIVGSTRCDNGSGTDQDTIADWTTLANQAVLVAENRKDCIAIVSPRRADVVGVTSESTQAINVITTANTMSSSSYAVIDSGWTYQYDRFNDKYCYVPANGHTAGIMARSDLLRDAWFSPAGFSRGQYLGITKLAFNPSQSSRDDLYRARVNPVVTFPGQGTILYGDKTALTSPSAFDRINVRRLFIVLEKAISTAAKSQLFEFNDAFTRAQFRAAVEPFLRDVKNRRGLVDFSVVCDETNNTDSVIDRNEFVCSIFVKPSRSINFITLNFVAARSGVEFSEIYGAV